MRNVLIYGVNSTIGSAIYDELSKSSNHNIYTVSRTPFDKSKNHQIIDIVNSDDIELINLPEEIHEFYYLPGSITLKPFKMTKLNDIKNDFDINILGFVKVLHQISQKLAKGNGAVVSFSSVAAKIGLEYHTSVSIAKGALEALNKSLAAEYSKSIRFNTIALSLSDTKMANQLLNNEKKIELATMRNPMGKIGNPTKIAKLATFINNPECDWLTGESISFDGGMKSLKVFN